MKSTAKPVRSSIGNTEESSSWEYPEGSGIRIAEIANRTGGTSFGSSFQVRVPAKLAGRRVIIQKKTKEEAETTAEEQLISFRQHGRRFSDLPVSAQEEAALAWSKFLKDAGLGFLEAAEAAVKVLRPVGGQRTVSAVLKELRDSKETRAAKGELRPRSWQDYQSRATKVEDAFGSRPINLVTGDDLAAWLRRIGKEGVGDGPLGSRSVKNYRSFLSELFTYAAQKRYCLENPFSRFTREERSEMGGQKNKRASVNVLSVAEADKLIRTAHEHANLGLLPSVILRLFCGLRTEEIVRLDWHDVRWQEPEPYVTISEEQAKARSARNVTIPANALEWLALCPKKEGPISPIKDAPGYCKKFRRLQKLAGFGQIDEKTGKWHSDAQTNDTRHSFGSYHFALHGNSILTATEMGHKQGDSVLFNHYRKLTTKAEGRLYFSIAPQASEGVITPFSSDPEKKAKRTG